MNFIRLCRISASLTLAAGLFAAEPAWPEPTPVNQVFQFQSSGSYVTALSGEVRRATCYLWIPETTTRLRGLLVLGANVPEHRLVGHELIRRMCAANDLAILWSTPSFLHPVDWTKPFPSAAEMQPEREAMVVFFQQQLEALAQASGYDEDGPASSRAASRRRFSRPISASAIDELLHRFLQQSAAVSAGQGGRLILPAISPARKTHKRIFRLA